MHAELVESLRLGLTVFLRGASALRDARRLVARKRQLRRLEAEAATLTCVRCKGRERIRRGCHQGRQWRFSAHRADLRRVHSHIAALAYPVLERAADSEGRDAGPAPAPATGALSE